MPITIHNLAILRASCEGKGLATYLLAPQSMKHWVKSTFSHGLISKFFSPTPTGRMLHGYLSLGTCGDGPAHLWPDSLELTERAKHLLATMENGA